MISIPQIMTHYVIKSVNLHSGSITNSLFYYHEVITMPTTIDIYDSLTSDELEQVTNILLEALAREKNISPEVFEIQTNIIMEA